MQNLRKTDVGRHGPTIFRCLAAQYPDFDLAGVRRTPDIGSFNWITGTIHGRDQNEYSTNYRQCGLCARASRNTMKT